MNSDEKLEKIYESLPEEVQEIIDKVLEAVDYFCWNITGDTAIDCYSAHSISDLYELVEEFVGVGYSGLTNDDLEYIQNLPDDIYDKATYYVQTILENTANKLFEECMQDPECRKGCEEDPDCRERMEEYLSD